VGTPSSYALLPRRRAGKAATNQSVSVERLGWTSPDQSSSLVSGRFGGLARQLCAQVGHDAAIATSFFATPPLGVKQK